MECSECILIASEARGQGNDLESAWLSRTIADKGLVWCFGLSVATGRYSPAPCMLGDVDDQTCWERMRLGGTGRDLERPLACSYLLSGGGFHLCVHGV